MAHLKKLRGTLVHQSMPRIRRLDEERFYLGKRITKLIKKVASIPGNFARMVDGPENKDENKFNLN